MNRGKWLFGAVTILLALVLVWSGVEDYRFPFVQTGRPSHLPVSSTPEARTATPLATDAPIPPQASPESPPADGGTTQNPSSAGSPPVPPREPEEVATSLLNLPLVDYPVRAQIDLKTYGPVDIDGRTYDWVLVYECNTFCHGDSPQVVEATLGRKFTSFTATTAVLDTARGEYQIDVILDEAPAVTYVTSPGQPADIDLDVTDVSRLRLEMYSPAALIDPVQCGANTASGVGCGELPGLAVGDPMVIP